MTITHLEHVLCLVPEKIEYDEATGRPFECGAGAQSQADQSARFAMEARVAADMPKKGERDIQTDREFEVGAGALPRSIQTQNFLNQLSPEQKTARQVAANALAAIEPAGNG